MKTLLPSQPAFAGHQTFALRSGWLKKGIDALSRETPTETPLFTREDALVLLGVGKNMVTSIRHWLLATRMAHEVLTPNGRRMQPTPLGTALFGSEEQAGWDAFLEDEATLWLLHWQLVGPSSLAYSWIWAFHCFREMEFDKSHLAQYLLDSAAGHLVKLPGRVTIERDIECFLHTYVPTEGGANVEDNLDCPLPALGLIRPSARRHFRFQIGSKPSLPPSIFAYALLTFWDWKQPPTTPLTFWDIVHAEGSPGRAFKLDEESVLEYLDALQEITQGEVRFEDEGVNRLVVRTSHPRLTPLQLLEAYYHA